MSVNGNGLSGLKESSSSLLSNRVFQELFAASTTTNNPDMPGKLQEFRNLLVGLKLRHEAIAEDKRNAESSAKSYEARILDLRQQLESKSRELEALKSKYQTEEKIVRLAQESFDHPQWVDVGGEEVCMVLKRSQAELTDEKKTLENEVSELEDEMREEHHELERRLQLTNATLNTVSELRSKIEMPREQRKQIFGRDGEEDEEQASAEDEGDGLMLADEPVDRETDLQADLETNLETNKEADREVNMVDEDDKAI